MADPAVRYVEHDFGPEGRGVGQLDAFEQLLVSDDGPGFHPIDPSPDPPLIYASPDRPMYWRHNCHYEQSDAESRLRREGGHPGYRESTAFSEIAHGGI